MRKKYLSKVKTAVAYTVGKQFFDAMLRNNKLIIKKINGIENWNELKTGAIVTCNHFNPLERFKVAKVFIGRVDYYCRQGKLYKFPWILWLFNAKLLYNAFIF